MEKIFRIFSKEYGNINQAALLLAMFALFSQVLGLFRDRLIAHFIGPGQILDIYYTAFRIPDLIFISVASLAGVAVMVPVLSAKMKDGITLEARKFLSDIFTVFFWALVIVSLLAFLLMPVLAPLVAPGFDDIALEKLVTMSRIMLLSPILLGLSNLFGSITQLYRKFFIFSLSPVLYNLGIIFGIVFLYPSIGLYGLALGVVLGAALHFVIQFFSSRGLGFQTGFSWKIDWQSIRSTVLHSVPRTLGLSMNNLALISIVAMASFLKPGSISIFNLSLNLQSVPLNIIGISYSVAAFPVLARTFSSGASGEFREHLKKAARAIVFWSIPITFIFIVLRAQIVRVLLGSPSFSWENTRLVAAALAIFSVSVLAQGMIALLSRAYYAKGNTRQPLLVNLCSSIFIVLTAYWLIYIFQTSAFFRYFIESMLKVSDIPGTEVLMLPLAYSFGTVLNFLIHWHLAKKEFMPGETFISKTFFQSLGASFFIGFVAYLSLNFFSPIFGTTTFWGVFFQGFVSAALGGIAGICVLFLLKNEELSEIILALSSRFWKAKIIQPPQEGL